jgi:hypothetical protein
MQILGSLLDVTRLMFESLIKWLGASRDIYSKSLSSQWQAGYLRFDVKTAVTVQYWPY